MTNLSPDLEPGADALLAVVRALIAELHPGRPLDGLSLDSALGQDLGLDSLGRVELMGRIERRFDVAMPERLFAEAETPRDLLRALAQARPGGGPRLLEVESLAVAGGEPAPASAETLPQALDWHARRHPGRLHIRFYSDEEEGQALSYAQLHAEAAKVAAGLQALGVRPGQAVAIMLPTSPAYFFSFMGALLAGAVPAPMYPPPRLAQLEEHLRRYVTILRNCAAPVLITVPEGKPHAKRLRALVDSLAQVVSVEDLAALPGGFEPPRIAAQDTAFLQYTSGSTGNPKGVVLTHANLMANIRAMGQAVQASPDDLFVSWLPLYHDMGLIGAWLGSLYHAMPLVVMSPLSFIAKPQRWLQAIHRHRGTLSASPNFGYETCVRRLENRDLVGLDLSSWRIAFNGAEAVVPETVERFADRFQPYGFKPEAMMPVYGLAESTVGLAFPPLGRGFKIDRVRREAFSRRGEAVPAEAEDPNALRFVACGLPLPGHQIRVVDVAGRELPDRRQGRVEFRGPSATSGYFRDSANTRALFHGEWLDSGDLGYIDGGELYVTGRAKDLVIRAGRNIYPQEVEQAVAEIDGVRKDGVAVFGGVDPASGTERLVVLAETRRLEPAQAEALRAKILAKVADLLGEPPDDIVLAAPGAVLKTSSGKVRRSAVRALYERGELGKPRRPGWPAYADLLLESLKELPRRGWLKAREWLFAGYAWGVFGLLAPAVWAAALALPAHLARWRYVRACTQAMRWATRTPLAVHGLENLPPPGQPFVLAVNHSSYLDVYALTAAIPRPLVFVAKAELGRSRLFGPALRRVGTVFVERFDAEKSVSDAAKLAESLRQGHALVFFPEGTFTRRPGLLPFHLGAFAAAVDAQVPIVPAALRGTRSMLRGGSWFLRPGLITLTLGQPIAPGLAQGDAWKTLISLRDQTREHILRHVGEPDLGRDRPEG
jgi:1-acyl-sn-glycerol-3-phosphate acyltransferase